MTVTYRLGLSLATTLFLASAINAQPCNPARADIGERNGKTITTNIVSIRVPSANSKTKRKRQHAGRKRKPDRIRETRNIEGSFVSFEVGDYIHAMIRKSDGQAISFFLIKPGMEYFLVLHHDEPLKLTYQVVDAYIPEAGGMETIKRLISAQAGKLTYAVWWKNIRTKFTMTQLGEKYDRLVQDSTVEP